MSELKTISIEAAETVSDDATVLCHDGNKIVETPMSNIKGTSSNGGLSYFDIYSDNVSQISPTKELIEAGVSIEPTTFFDNYYILKDSEWEKLINGQLILRIPGDSNAPTMIFTNFCFQGYTGIYNTINFYYATPLCFTYNSDDNSFRILGGKSVISASNVKKAIDYYCDVTDSDDSDSNLEFSSYQSKISTIKSKLEELGYFDIDYDEE